jgi:CRISPR-associated protein Csm1
LEFGELGVCVVDGRLPATGKSEDGLSLSDLGFDFWELGRWIRREASEGLVVVESAELPLQNAQDVLRTRFFGRYRVRLEDVKTLPQNSFDGIVRVWDCGAHHFSKNAGEQSIWGGYALKPLSTYTPVVPGKDRIKSFDEIAEVGLGKEHRGFAALGIIKGDVDNLGKMFSDAAAGANFAKMAALSRILNNYFAVYLPWLLGTEYRDTYTLFAGGDDFFLLAPWCHAQKLALSIRNNFLRYAGQNPEKPEVHLSVGVVTTKAGAPVSSMADAAENALEDAKHFRRSNNGRSKDAITVFDETFAWEDLSRVGKIENAILTIERNLFAVSKKRDQQLPTVWFYQLLEFLGLARAHEATKDPRLAVWKARMAYQTARFVEREGVERDKIPVLTSEIYNKQLEMIGNQGERAFLKVALYNTIYARRSVDDGASR